jgi:hypothetical protein
MVTNFEHIATDCLRGKISGNFIIALTNTQRKKTHSSLLRKNINGYYFESPFGLVGRTYYDFNGNDITNPHLFDIIDFEKD